MRRAPLAMVEALLADDADNEDDFERKLSAALR